MFIVELLCSQWIALKENERANADLLRRVNAFSAEKREVDERLAKLHADLDHKLVAERSRKGELDRLRKEFQAKKSVLQQELSQAREELDNKSLELRKRDSELQAASQGLEAANRQAEDAKVELDCARSVFQSKMDGLWRELDQALAEKEETEKQTDKNVARLQKEVKVFKLIKYRDEYNDGV